MWKRVLLVLLGVGTAHLEAQESSVPARRFSIVLTAGGPLGGPSASAMHQMREMGYDDTQPYECLFFDLFCSGPTDYPVHFRGASRTLVVRYALSGRWAVSAGLGGGHLGSAMGYRLEPTPFGTHVDSGQWSDAPLWLVAQVSLMDRIHVGLGPSLHRLSRVADPAVSAFDSARLGLTGEATLELPRARRVFWILTMRGHWVPGSEDVPPASFGVSPALRTTFSYVTLQTGVGFRL